MRATIILIVMLIGYSTMACECKVGYSMENNLRDVAVVAKVKVLSLNDTSQTLISAEQKPLKISPPFTSGFSPNLKVLKIYKGELGKSNISLSGTEYCSDRYTQGQEYVLFIYRGPTGSYYTRICEHNFAVPNSEAMKKLDILLSQTPGL